MPCESYRVSYEPLTAVFDEAFSADGRVRPVYAEVVGALGELDLAVLADAVTEEAAQRGVSFVLDRVHEAFSLDPVPRLIAAGEWSLLSRGLAQRVRALDRFIADVYASSGSWPRAWCPSARSRPAITSSRLLVGTRRPRSGSGWPGWTWCAGRGRFGVLEDNVRTPSGLTYAVAARTAVDRAPARRARRRRRSLDAAFDMLGERAARGRPGRRRRSARGDALGRSRQQRLVRAPSAGPAAGHPARAARQDLYPSRGRLRARGATAAAARVDVVYRRTDEDRLMDERGATHVGRPTCSSTHAAPGASPA